MEKLKGLTTTEVEERKQQGLQNDYEANVTKSTKDIVKDNIFTLFNFLNLSIAICLALVGAFSNLFFMVIIFVNCFIGIYQELSARNLVNKLSILSKELVSVIRNGVEESIHTTEIVVDDLIKLKTGQQVPSDATVLKGRVEMNEALLTGESDLIIKEAEDIVLSGSFIAGGSCIAKVIRVGEKNYATKIVNEAKIHKPIKSELNEAIRKVSKFTSFVIIPLGMVLFFQAYSVRGDALKPAVVASAAALLGMLPKGLALLISIALTTAVMKLAKKNILVQNMYAIETLAHVDTLCLDKTGTITEGKMKVTDVKTFGIQDYQAIIGSYLEASTDNNLTMQAVRAHFSSNKTYLASEVISFSSDRKWGSMYLETIGTVVLGAPEKLITSERMPTIVEEAQKEGQRVLMLAVSQQKKELPSDLEPIAIIMFDDPIRKNANETMAYLYEEGIDIKIISGDNPLTVSHIGKKAGLKNYENYIDLSKVKDEDAVFKAAQDYTIFGRVSPHQKKLLVQSLKNQGRTVAMTGDGVNDVLALREADCSIAMAEGDGATRQISNLVLLNSDFTALPDSLFEGRRVVNNVTKVASVFFIKTIYSFLLTFLCLATSIAFPFAPIQITLLDLAIEGYPSFFLSFEEDKRKVTKDFLPTVLKRALPYSLLVIGNIIVIHFYSQAHQLTEIQSTTLMYYLLIAVSSLAVIKACFPFNPLRIFLAVTTTIGTYIAAILFHHLLEISRLDAQTFPIFIIMVTGTLFIMIIYSSLSRRRMKTRI